MKIFIPFTVKDIGGTSTFAKKFQKGMHDLGHDVFFEYRENYDILFLIVQAPFKFILDAKKRKRPIVQRLDGTYYWSIASWKFIFYNLKARIIRHLFTDFTVYQSKYCQYCSTVFLGKKENDKSTIIYNGVDTNIFSPLGEIVNLKNQPNQNIFFTASDFRRKDQIFPILKALEVYYEKYNKNFKFVIAGIFSRELLGFENTFKKFTWIQFLGKIANNDLPKYERSSDVFLFTHLNPPCPNNIIEAIACGLPICGVADGAMPELVTNGKNGKLINISGDSFWKKRDFNEESFAKNIHNIVNNRNIYSLENPRKTLRKFSLQSMVKKYEKIFINLLNKK